MLNSNFPSGRMKWIARVLKVSSLLWILILVASHVAGFFYTQTFLDVAFDYPQLSHAVGEMSVFARIGLAMIMCVACIPALVGLWYVRKFFQAVIDGDPFTRTAIHSFRIFALGVLISALLEPVQGSLVMAYITSFSPISDTVWMVDYSLGLLWQAGIGLMFVWFSYALEISKVHQDEVESFL